MALSFILNAAGLIVPLSLESKFTPQAPATACTNVQLIVGGGEADLGGSVPHIALWDNTGNRIAQYHPKKNEKIAEKKSSTLSILNSQTEPPNSEVQPYYIMLSNPDSDAICLSAITVSTSQISVGMYGDTGYMCGQSWFLSTQEIGSNLASPKCVWLDGDHTNGINAQAMSFHLNDMAPNADKIAEYGNNSDYLCKSTPRFSIWGNLEPNSLIPFFNPPLKYAPDSAGGEGADLNPHDVIDKVVYDKSVYMYQGKRKVRVRRSQGRSNRNPQHLITTDYPAHSAKELCEHPMSHGWDTVSTVERLYCDMENKQLYVFCEDASANTTCFDTTEKKIHIRDYGTRSGMVATPFAQKNYTTFAYWKPSSET